MELFIQTPDGQLVNIVPVRHRWSKQTFKPHTCYIKPEEAQNFEAVE